MRNMPTAVFQLFGGKTSGSRNTGLYDSYVKEGAMARGRKNRTSRRKSPLQLLFKPTATGPPPFERQAKATDDSINTEDLGKGKLWLR